MASSVATGTRCSLSPRRVRSSTPCRESGKLRMINSSQAAYDSVAQLLSPGEPVSRCCPQLLHRCPAPLSSTANKPR
eukprot:gene6654-1188_t